MTRFYFCLFLLGIGNYVFAQHDFQPGYIIKNNIKIECLIKNEGWIKSPNSVTYKLDPSDDSKIAKASEIQGFYIENTKHKFVSRYFQPVYHIPITYNFVQVLVEGEASLYKYITAAEDQYYFETKGQDFMLLHHEVRIEGSKMEEDYRFRAQLFELLSCVDFKKENFQKLEFKQKELMRVFNDFNACQGNDFTDLTIYKEKGKLNLHLMAGTSLFDVGSSSNSSATSEITSPSSILFKAGGELEYVLPIRNNKLSLFTGIEYSQNEVEGTYKMIGVLPSTGVRVSVNTTYEYEYDLLSIPLGIRFYMYLNPNNAFFVNPGVSYNYILSEKEYNFNHISTNHTVGQGLLEDGLGFFGGFGYKFKSKFGAEVRYISTSNISIDEFSTKSTSLILLLSYNLF